MKISIKNILFFLFLLVFQLLILDQTSINIFINPYMYPLIIILLPFEISGWLLLISAFILGFVVDVFNGTVGLHMFATVGMAAFRPLLINLFSLQKLDNNNSLNIKSLGLIVSGSFIGILLFIHHVLYFVLESFSFANFHFLVLRIILSTLVSLLLCMLLLLIFKNNNKGNER